MSYFVELCKKTVVGFLIFSLLLISFIAFVDYQEYEYRLDESAYGDVGKLTAEYRDELDKVFSSIGNVSRSAYVFDTVMSKQDKVSRFFLSIKATSDQIRQVRLVVGDLSFGDPVHSELVEWYNFKEDVSDIKVSPMYVDGDLTYRDVVFPVFYNAKVVGYMSYSVVTGDLVDLGEYRNDLMIVHDGLVVASNNGRLGDTVDEIDRDVFDHIVEGKVESFFKVDDGSIVDLLVSRWLEYVVYVVLTLVIWLFLVWNTGRVLEGHFNWGNDLIRMIEERDEKSFTDSTSIEIPSMRLFEDRMLLSVRSLLNEVVRDRDLVEEVDRLNRVIVDEREISTKLRSLMQNYFDRVGELERDLVRRDGDIEALSGDIMVSNDETAKLRKVLDDFDGSEFGNIYSELDRLGEVVRKSYNKDDLEVVKHGLVEVSFMVMYVVSKLNLLSLCEVEVLGSLDVDFDDLNRVLKKASNVANEICERFDTFVESLGDDRLGDVYLGVLREKIVDMENEFSDYQSRVDEFKI